jgi:hypothetical protein
MTGVGVNKHQVTSEDFVGNNLENYPSFISILEKETPELKTAAFSASQLFSDNFTADADIHQTFENNDELVKNAVINQMSSDEDFILGHFSQPELTGEVNGYSSIEYTTALSEMDIYIGEIMTALKARPNYLAENWLVVITSNKGGVNEENAPSNDLFSEPTRNTFTIWYSSKLSSTYIEPPKTDDLKYTGFSPLFTYEDDSYVRARVQNADLYNLVEGSWTLQFLYKNSQTNNQYNSFIVSKGKNFGGDYPWAGEGWRFYTRYRHVAFGSRSSATWESEDVVCDNQWHVISVVIDRDADFIDMYIDGRRQEYRRQGIDEYYIPQLATSEPLTVGYNTGNGTNIPQVFIKNLQIYNTAFTEQEVAELSCKTEISEGHPHYSELMGYWPMDEVSKKVLKERTGKYGTGADLILEGPYEWRDFSTDSEVLCPSPGDDFFKMVPNSVDNSFLTLHWLGISVKPKWELDGKGWSLSYKSLNP